MIDQNESAAAWAHCTAVVRPALLLAPRTYLHDVQNRLAADGIQLAVAQRDTAALYDWIVRLLDRRGISKAAAMAFAEGHGSARWQDAEQDNAYKTSKLLVFSRLRISKGRSDMRAPDLLEVAPCRGSRLARAD